MPTTFKQINGLLSKLTKVYALISAQLNFVVIKKSFAANEVK